VSAKGSGADPKLNKKQTPFEGGLSGDSMWSKRAAEKEKKKKRMPAHRGFPKRAIYDDKGKELFRKTAGRGKKDGEKGKGS